MNTINSFSEIVLGKLYKMVSIKEDIPDCKVEIDEDTSTDEGFGKSLKKYKESVILVKAIVKLDSYEYVIGKIMSNEPAIGDIVEFFKSVNNNIVFPIFYHDNISHMFPSDDIMLNGKFPDWGGPHCDIYLNIILQEVDIDDF